MSEVDIHPSAQLGDNVNILGALTLGANVQVGANVTFYPDVHVGTGTRIMPGAVIGRPAHPRRHDQPSHQPRRRDCAHRRALRD